MRKPLEMFKAALLGFVLMVALPLTEELRIPHVRAVSLSLFVTLLILEIVSGEKFRRPPMYFLWCACFAIVMAIGLTITQAPNYGSAKLGLFVSYFIVLGYLVYSWTSGENTIRAFFVGLVAGGVALLAVFLIRYGSPASMLEEVNRFYRLRLGEEGNPIHLARYLGIAALCAGMLATAVTGRKKQLTCLAIVLLSVSYMALTGSKGPFLALFGGLMFTTVVYAKKVSHALVVAAFGTVVAIAVVILFLSIMPTEFVEERIWGKLDTLSNRLPGYVTSLRLVLDMPFLSALVGYGTGSYGYYSHHADMRAYPHNILLEAIYENGLLGAIVLVLAIAAPLLTALTMRKSLPQVSRSTRGVTLMAVGGYVYWLLNAQVSGDLGSNSFIGVFAGLIYNAKHVVRAAHMGQRVRKTGRTFKHVPNATGALLDTR